MHGLRQIQWNNLSPQVLQVSPKVSRDSVVNLIHGRVDQLLTVRDAYHREQYDEGAAVAMAQVDALLYIVDHIKKLEV